MYKAKMKTTATEFEKQQWVQWAEDYDKYDLFDALLHSIQGAKSECRNCHREIFCDIIEGGGVPDWKTSDGDYGCINSPYTNDQGTGGHEPVKG